MKYTDCGIAIIRNKYLQPQIFYITYQVLSLALRENAVKQSIWMLADFFFDNTILLLLSNSLLMKLLNIFLILFPNENIRGDGWWIVCIID